MNADYDVSPSAHFEESSRTCAYICPWTIIIDRFDRARFLRSSSDGATNPEGCTLSAAVPSVGRFSPVRLAPIRRGQFNFSRFTPKGPNPIYRASVTQKTRKHFSHTPTRKQRKRAARDNKSQERKALCTEAHPGAKTYTQKQEESSKQPGRVSEKADKRRWRRATRATTGCRLAVHTRRA